MPTGPGDTMKRHVVEAVNIHNEKVSLIAKKKLVTQIFAVQNVNDVYIHHISYPIIDND